MAKSSPDSKSQFIRQALLENPGKGPSEVAQILKNKGIEVSNAYVSVVKSSMKKQGRKARRPRRSATPEVKAVRSSGGNKETMGTVEAAVDFVSSVGSFEKAREALAKLEKLSEVLGRN